MRKCESCRMNEHWLRVENFTRSFFCIFAEDLVNPISEQIE